MSHQWYHNDTISSKPWGYILNSNSQYVTCSGERSIYTINTSCTENKCSRSIYINVKKYQCSSVFCTSDIKTTKLIVSLADKHIFFTQTVHSVNKHQSTLWQLDKNHRYPFKKYSETSDTALHILHMTSTSISIVMWTGHLKCKKKLTKNK